MIERLARDSAIWKVVVRQKGLVVAYRDIQTHTIDRPHLLSDGRGAILGTLFERSSMRRYLGSSLVNNCALIDADRSASFVRTGGRELVQNYWGQYVAFLEDPNSGARWILRDPTGRIPCYKISRSGIDIYFARIADCAFVTDLATTPINSHFLGGVLLYVVLNTHETALQDVTKVMAGECVEYSSRGIQTRSFYWNPLHFCTSDVIESHAEAVRLTRETVSACVEAWASCFKRILLYVSGGLDSSIVLACLTKTSRPGLFCINHYTDHPYRDERVYARAISKRCGVALIEEETTPKSYQMRFDRYETRVASPYQCYQIDEKVGAAVDLSTARDIQAQFFGHLGDELFLRATVLPDAADYLWRRRSVRGLAAKVLDDAVEKNISFWRSLRASLRYGLARRTLHVRHVLDVHERTLVRGNLRDELERDESLWHPLFRHVRDVPPSKFFQAYALAHYAAIEPYPYPAQDQPLSISPLASQPLMELSMRIPTYILLSRGRDRGVARDAFAHILPDAIRLRRGKCVGDVIERSKIRASVESLRALLLDGYLVEHGFLDKQRVAEALCGGIQAGTRSVMEVFDCAAAEVWTRAWSGNRLGEFMSASS